MKDDIMFINGKTLLNLAPIKNMIPTKEKFMGTSYGLSEAGYDIRIKQTIEYVYDEYGERIIVTHPDSGDQEILLGNCVLASSIEEFQMPNQVAAEVKDKSTHARNFLSVFNTAIENDWHGFLTLELVSIVVEVILFMLVKVSHRYDLPLQLMKLIMEMVSIRMRVTTLSQP